MQKDIKAFNVGFVRVVVVVVVVVRIGLAYVLAPMVWGIAP